MKARNRKTGEIVDIIAFSNYTIRSSSDYVSYIDSKGVEHDIERGLNYYWDFEPIEDASASTINWEQRRYEIAKAAMQGILSNTGLNASVIQMRKGKWESDVACASILYANALIKELKEEKLNDLKMV